MSESASYYCGTGKFSHVHVRRLKFYYRMSPSFALGRRRWLPDMDGSYVSIENAAADNPPKVYPSANPELEMRVLLSPLSAN